MTPTNRTTAVAVGAVLAGAVIAIAIFVMGPPTSDPPQRTQPAGGAAPGGPVHAQEGLGRSMAAAPAGATLTKVYAVEGMHCQSCANRIKQYIEAVPGVVVADVSLEQKKVTISMASGTGPSDEQVLQAVDKAGYKATVLAEQGF